MTIVIHVVSHRMVTWRANNRQTVINVHLTDDHHQVTKYSPDMETLETKRRKETDSKTTETDAEKNRREQTQTYHEQANVPSRLATIRTKTAAAELASLIFLF